MQYPNITQYKEAIQDADSFDELSDDISAVMNVHEPVFASGNFAVVFKMVSNKKTIALKCFLKDLPKRNSKQKKIVKYLKQNNSTYFIEYQFLEDEIWVNDNDHPIALMEWIEAPTLGEKISEYCESNDRTSLKKLADSFFEFALWIIDQPFAHGDLKHDNILVCNNYDIKLVDYDGMFVPELSGEKTDELGGKSYQHPFRNSTTFDSNLDDFSILIIYASLVALKNNPSLYKRYNNGQNIIFSSNDFIDFENSNIYKEIFKFEELRAILNDISNSLNVRSINIPEVEQSLKNVVEFDKLLQLKELLAKKEVRLKKRKNEYIKKEKKLNDLKIDLQETKQKLLDEVNEFDKRRAKLSIDEQAYVFNNKAVLQRGLELNDKDKILDSKLDEISKREDNVSDALNELEKISKELNRKEDLIKLENNKLDNRGSYIAKENKELKELKKSLDKNKLNKLKQKLESQEFDVAERLERVNRREREHSLKEKKVELEKEKLARKRKYYDDLNKLQEKKNEEIDRDKIELEENRKNISKREVDLESRLKFVISKEKYINPYTGALVRLYNIKDKTSNYYLKLRKSILSFVNPILTRINFVKYKKFVIAFFVLLISSSLYIIKKDSVNNVISDLYEIYFTNNIVLKKQGKNLKELIPRGWKVEQFKYGDLNNDKIDDLTIIFTEKEPEGNLRRRVLAIYVSKNHKFSLFEKSDNFIIKKSILTNKDKFKKIEISNNLLNIYYETEDDESKSMLKYQFKKIDNKFVLYIYSKKRLRKKSGVYKYYVIKFYSHELGEKYIAKFEEHTLPEEWRKIPFNGYKTLKELDKPFQWSFLGFKI